jgi:N-acetylmuramate 1-kinase
VRTREAAIAAFLAAHGFGAARQGALPQDASFRRYVRLIGGRRPALLMDAPPPEDVRMFVRVALYLAGLGLSVPEIIACDTEQGLVLEEDLGEAMFPAMMSKETIPALFDAAVDVLAVMQRGPLPDFLPRWDVEAMRDTAVATLCDWWWPAAFGGTAPEVAREEFAQALNIMLAPLAAGPVCVVHRDFFAGNLMWLPERKGVRRVGVIDFQTAALGHPAYDLVSLLEDARREIPPGVAARARARFLAARPELDADRFAAAFAACAAQRHLRVAGQWVRLAVRDRRPQYLAYGPRTWRLLETALSHPVAAPLACAMDRWIPMELRGTPAGMAA